MRERPVDHPGGSGAALYGDVAGGVARPVRIELGDRSLSIIETDGTVIAHWPLAALRARGRARARPLLIAPRGASHDDAPDAEWLVIEDTGLAAAVAGVCPDLHRRPPRRVSRRRISFGWLFWGLVVGTAVVATALLTRLPDLPDRLAAAVPAARADALGARLSGPAAAAMMPTAVTGSSAGVRRCVGARGQAAIETLVGALVMPPAAAGGDAVRAGARQPGNPAIAVIDTPRAVAGALPGRRLLIGSGLITSAQAPEVLAAALAPTLRGLASGAPLRRLARMAGPLAFAALVVDDPFDRAAELGAAMIGTGAPDGAATGIPVASLGETAPARSADRPGPADPGAEVGDGGDSPAARLVSPVAGADRLADSGGPTPPLMSDADWVALNDICAETAALGRF